MSGEPNPTTANTPQVLLEHHLKQLRLPTFLREYDKVARQCAAESVDYPRYLLRLTEQELLDRERRATERRIHQARFPVVKSLDTFEFLAIPEVNKALVLELARCEFLLAGGLQALTAILERLPKEFATPVLIVQHRAPEQEKNGFFRDLLARRCQLPILEAAAYPFLIPGVVTLAPSRLNAVIRPDRRIDLLSSPDYPFNRSAATVTLTSAAAAFGAATIGVILSGSNNDGATGVRAVKAQGGRVFVQDRFTSYRFDMPAASLHTGCVDYILPAETIAHALVTFTMVQGASELFQVSSDYRDWTQQI